MRPQERLERAVNDFVATVTPALSGLAVKAGLDAARSEHDVSLEAYNLAAGFAAADRRVSDQAILSMIMLFSPRVATPLTDKTPGEVRRTGLLDGAAEWLQTPSALFSLLRDADLVDGGRRARDYYDRALEIAHATIALDGFTGQLELAALESYRAMLLRLLPPASRADVQGPPAAATDDHAPLGTVEGLDEPEHSLEELLDELNDLIGLDAVKAEVRLVADLLKVERLRRERALPVAVQSRHLVFTGNPGTGKTTVARLLAQIYRALGVVERGHLVETDRSGLVAGFVGQTAGRVAEVFNAADGGVLLIDEAHGLARGGERDFGLEAIDALVKLMEDRRDRVVVIVAGYTAEMEVFLDANPGLRSRFPKTIHFADYTTDELVAILDHIAAKNHYRLTDGAKARFRDWLDAVPRGPRFGNGRLARNLFEHAVARHATRVVAKGDISDAELMTITAHDVPAPDASP